MQSFEQTGDDEMVVLLRMTPRMLVVSELILLTIAVCGVILPTWATGGWAGSIVTRVILGAGSVWAVAMFVRTPIWFISTKGAVVEGTRSELRHTRAMRLFGVDMGFGFRIERITENLHTVEFQLPPPIDLPGDSQVRYDFVSTTQRLRVDTARWAVPDDFHDRFRRWKQLVSDTSGDAL